MPAHRRPPVAFALAIAVSLTGAPFRFLCVGASCLAALSLVAIVGRAPATEIDAVVSSTPSTRSTPTSPSMPGRWERANGTLGMPASADAEHGGFGASVARVAQHGREVAWSDARGVVRGSDGRVERAAMADVVALAFADEGVLWIGSAQGLFRWAPGGRPERRRLFGGEAANRIRDLVAVDDRLAVATEGGLFYSPAPRAAGRHFQPLDALALATPVERLAFRVAPVSAARRVVELWSARAGALERIVGLPTDAGLRVIGRDRIVAPRHGEVARPVGLRVEAHADGPHLLLVQPDAIFARVLAAPGAPIEDAAPWRVDRPTLAPGARIQRLAVGADGARFAATDRGVFESPGPGAPYRRARGEAGFEACSDIVSGERGGAWARCRSGLLRRVDAEAALTKSLDGTLESPVLGGQAALRPASPPLAARAPLALDPSLAEIRVRALAHARLDRARGDRLFQGLARRGLLPEVSLRFGADFDRDDRRHADQAFVSGDTRHLFDRTRDHGTGFDVALELDWALGEIAYPDDAVDLSREHRQVVSLRDDIADELHQLYFERARIRTRLEDPAVLSTEEERALRHRAAELLAGLDAWTGGWLSAWHAQQPPATRLHARSPGPDHENGIQDP